MKQNKALQQNFTFSVMVENSNTGDCAWLKLPTTRDAVKELFAKLQIKGNNYLISDCNFPIEQITSAILRCRNLNELNYFAVKLRSLIRKGARDSAKLSHQELTGLSVLRTASISFTEWTTRSSRSAVCLLTNKSANFT